MISGSTFEKKFVIETFLFEGDPAGSSTTRSKSSLAADVIAGRPEIRLSAIFYQPIYAVMDVLLVANNQYSVPFTLILSLAFEDVSATAVENITRFEL